MIGYQKFPPIIHSRKIHRDYNSCDSYDLYDSPAGIKWIIVLTFLSNMSE